MVLDRPETSTLVLYLLCIYRNVYYLLNFELKYLMATWVCKKCFYEHRINADFDGCPHTSRVVQCTWNQRQQWCETTALCIREIPQNFPYNLVYNVRICNPYKRVCKNDKCTFAHGPAEQKDWQQKLRISTGESPSKKFKLHSSVPSASCSSGASEENADEDRESTVTADSVTGLEPGNTFKLNTALPGHHFPRHTSLMHFWLPLT